MLRKTMLDECKGEKFYELLALLSSIVLKKVLASSQKQAQDGAIARDLATAVTLSSKGQASLLPLAIAHKAALTNVLRRKEEKRRKFAKFERLLDLKADEIQQRIRKRKETPPPRKQTVPQKEVDAIKKQLKDNWLGNQKWVSVMLHGDNVHGDAAFLEAPFEKIWAMVEQGRRLEDAVPEAGLLENLQFRLDEQQARLQKWKDFQIKMQREAKAKVSGPEKDIQPTKEFKFDDHLQLQLGSKGLANIATLKQSLQPEYQDIISELDAELARAADTYHGHSFTESKRRRSSFGTSRSHVRSRTLSSHGIPKHALDHPKIAKPALHPRKSSENPPPMRQASFSECSTATPLDSETTLVGQPSTVRAVIPTPEQVHDPVEQYEDPEHNEDAPYPLPTINPPMEVPHTSSRPSRSSSSPPPNSLYSSEPPILEPPSFTAEEALAAQIISTIGDATPSPIKKPQPRLSLMERTRMSMAFTTDFHTIAESPSPSPTLPEPPTPQTTQLDRQTSLLERTRLTMAASNAKPRASLAPRDTEKQKSTARQSIFPVNQFDTPRNRRSFQTIEEAKSGEHTPKEDLFSDDVDYDRVFKSRPRVATSPAFGTPKEEGLEDEEFDEGVTGVDLADVDADEDEEGFTQAWENSPLRRAGRGRMFT